MRPAERHEHFGLMKSLDARANGCLIPFLGLQMHYPLIWGGRPLGHYVSAFHRPACCLFSEGFGRDRSALSEP